MFSGVKSVAVLHGNEIQPHLFTGYVSSVSMPQLFLWWKGKPYGTDLGEEDEEDEEDGLANLI